jgi:spermidine/putrescine ABC transporter ATP-binding subunit
MTSVSNHNDAVVSIRNVSKRFGDVTAVDNVSLDIQRNEFFALLGPSGCGKTTLLRMLAGLERLTAGEIVIDGENMVATPPNKRPVNMVFQSYAVFPHMSVEQNVAYGLKVGGTPSAEIGPRVTEALEMVRMGPLRSRMPDQLSGGQRQRVALARALVKRPKVLLLDEPLSALDAKLREQMQLELTRLQETVGITFVIVTHDQDEALSMASRIAVMDHGRVCQIASPQELYERPATRFVADFIGKVNLIDGEGLGEMALPAEAPVSGRVAVAVRPEKLKLSAAEPTDPRLIKSPGRVRDVAYYGDTSNVFVETPAARELSVNVQNERRSPTVYRRGDQVWVSWSPEDTLILTE